MTTLDQPRRLTPEQATQIRDRVRAIEAGRDPIGDAQALQSGRQQAELSQAQLAAAVGRSVAVIKNIESGRTKLRGPLRETLWRTVVTALEAKCERDGAFYPRLEALVRSGRTKEELAIENTQLAQRVGELEARVTNLSAQLAEHIEVVRPALEKLEKAAAAEGIQILKENL